MPRYRLFYHAVWTTKGREPYITAQYKSRVLSAIRAKVIALGGQVHALNAMPDHVHVLMTLPPSIAISEAIKQIKGSSSHVASRLEGECTPFAWQAEYSVSSVSESHVAQVTAYIDDQERHHAASVLNAHLEPD
jgi:putative transposase